MKILKDNIALYVLIIGLFLTFSHTARAQDVPDSFDPNANNNVYTITAQTDGKILIRGNFTTLNGGTVSRNYFARLNNDGTIDTAFDPNANNSVISIAVQTDGKILIGGIFRTLTPNGGATVTRSFFARLNSDGTVDTAFDPNPNLEVDAIAVQTDGKILVGGEFTTVAGVARNRIARLNSDGTVDTAFNPNANHFVQSFTLQTDGKILIGGGFTTVGGVARNRIARLNSDGTIDMAFDPNANSIVQSITLQADGKILIGGFFTAFTPNGGATVARFRIARLNSDGTVDTTFDPNPNGEINSIKVQTDGKILIGGFFTTLNGGAVSRNYIARLNSDGTVDTTFNPNADDRVYVIEVQTDGKILIGGFFTTLNGGAVSRNYIARLGFRATAAGVSVAGRVRTPNGRGLSNAYVTLTDASGNQRLARTTAFGYFHFEDVAAGETYIVGVSSKRYRFAPQVLSINQDIADVVLTGEDIFGSPR